MAVARASECDYEQHNQVAALCAIAIRLDEDEKAEVLKEALNATYAIIEGHSAIALHTLVPHLSPPLLAEALAKLREEEYHEYCVLEYSAFAKHLTKHELKRMLEDIFDSYNMSFAEESQIPVAKLFAAALPAELLEDALDAASK
ncbi:MAG: hypothetical protein R3E79_40370 [Caldilineaceae bacterium]